MKYISIYSSPLGNIVIVGDEDGVSNILFEDQVAAQRIIANNLPTKDIQLLKDVKIWLDMYFSGIELDKKPAISLHVTDFQREVLSIVSTIRYGETMTYGDIAKIIAQKRSINKMSPQAICYAVANNQILLLIPCHRVIGANGSMTGYSGGIKRKIQLLNMEGYRISSDVEQL